MHEKSIMISQGRKREGCILGLTNSIILCIALVPRLIKTRFAKVPVSILMCGLAGIINFGYHLSPNKKSVEWHIMAMYSIPAVRYYFLKSSLCLDLDSPMLSHIVVRAEVGAFLPDSRRIVSCVRCRAKKRSKPNLSQKFFQFHTCDSSMQT